MKLRSPVCCVLGHVDAGKTSLLDKLRTTNKQAKEAGGITQNISAWNLSEKDIHTFIDKYSTTTQTKSQIPGLLMIDTPGHEAFLKLRTTGTNLCDIAILVVDIHKGIEKQTMESIKILKNAKTPFVIACNKLDTLYGWKSQKNGCFKQNVDQQSNDTKLKLKTARDQLFVQFANIGINVEFYHINNDHKTTVNIVPLSAVTGEGIPDLLVVILRLCEKFMKKKIEFHSDTFKGLVLKEDHIQGHGTCIRLLLVDGMLKKGSKFYLQNIPTCCTVKSLLIQEHQTQELKLVDSVTAACSCIIVTVESINNIIPGSELLSTTIDSTAEVRNSDSTTEVSDTKVEIGKGKWGAHLHSDSSGTLDALIKVFQEQKFPIAGYSIGNMYKTDVMKIIARNPNNDEYTPMIVNFGGNITEDAETYAKNNMVEIIESPIIYRLLENAIVFHKKQQQEFLSRHEKSAGIFPCKLKIIGIYRASDPIIIGISVEEGSLRLGTPLAYVKDKQEIHELGDVFHMKTPLGQSCEKADKGDSVSVEIRNSKKKAGIHFEQNDLLFSNITRKSLDILKQHFASNLSKSDVKCIIEIKKIFNIV
jgi:translation initiation factor 5B